MPSAPPARAPQAKSARLAVAGGKNGNTRRSMISPASWEKIITGITDDRRVAKPPRKSALPYRVAERSAKTIVAIAVQIND
jgi:hypothetical protein